jgi:hypothetical protein
MKSATVNEIKKELQSLAPEQVLQLCMRLAKYKKDNKELFSYLLFEAHNEAQYIEQIKQDILYEIETKVLERYNKTDWTNLLQENKMDHINTINNIPFKTIEYYIDQIKTKVIK